MPKASYAAVALLLFLVVAGCAGPPPSHAVATKELAENAYLSIRIAWLQGKVGDDVMTEAEKAYAAYYDAQKKWVASGFKDAGAAAVAKASAVKLVSLAATAKGVLQNGLRK